VQIYNTDDLCSGEQVFFAATGVSDGNLLQGVRYYRGGATTNSIVMRASSGTVRMIKTQHKWSKPSVSSLTPSPLLHPALSFLSLADLFSAHVHLFLDEHLWFSDWTI